MKILLVLITFASFYHSKFEVQYNYGTYSIYKIKLLIIKKCK
jgi:hypothetical protein